MKETLADPVWSGDELLRKYCMKWFGRSETEMRIFLGLATLPDLILEPKENFLQVKPAMVEEIRRSEPPDFPKRALTPAEKQRAYRERKKRVPETFPENMGDVNFEAKRRRKV